MELIAWMYDVAREQSPSEALLDDLCARSLAAGYNALGLYLEHRFVYASAPWAAGVGALEPDVVRRVAARFAPRGLRIIPFLNTLGHLEGFIRAEGGQWLAEGPGSNFWSRQICATRPECAAFARGLVRDALAVFDDEWVHVGGDETKELGDCPRCAERVAAVGQAGLYAEYYGPLCRWVIEQGRRPCLWGDMLVEHPAALDALPRETVIFDWQYFHRPAETLRRFRERGFDVVACPSVQSYNSVWCFLGATQQNIDEHAEDAAALGARGVCVTTWEASFFTQYRAFLPVVFAAGRRLSQRSDWRAALRAETDDAFVAVAEILGDHIPAAATFLAPGTWRQLRDRLIIRQNPFYLWQDWRSEACGVAGERVLALCTEIERQIPAGHVLGVANTLYRVAVEWVRAVQQAYDDYQNRRLEASAATLRRAVDLFERLRAGLTAAAEAGGSRADVHRLDGMIAHVRAVADRIAALRDEPRSAAGDRMSPSYLPAFETIAHVGYVRNDQAAWRTGSFR